MHGALTVAVVQFDSVGRCAAEKCRVEQVGAACPARHRNGAAAAHCRNHRFRTRRDVAGCAGNGQGLDQNGQPISAGGSPTGPITADLQSIQDNVFTPICSKCHIGASAPEGLQLDAAHSYDFLVGVPSVEQPAPHDDA